MIRPLLIASGLALAAAPAFAADAMRPGASPAESWWETHAACAAAYFAASAVAKDKAEGDAMTKLHKGHYALGLARLAQDRSVEVNEAEKTLEPVGLAGVDSWKSQFGEDEALARKALDATLALCAKRHEAYLKEFPSELKTLQAVKN